MAWREIADGWRGTYRGLRRRRRSNTLNGSESQRSNCCQFTPLLMSAIWRTGALRNYWGYNTIGFFAPEPRYAHSDGRDWPSSGRRSACFTKPVSRVILDVVYNHTAEGNELGPTPRFGA